MALLCKLFWCFPSLKALSSCYYKRPLKEFSSIFSIFFQPSIGVVLAFIGSKMILDFFGEHSSVNSKVQISYEAYMHFKIRGFIDLSLHAGFHVSTEASLGFVAISLSTGVMLSLLKKAD